MADDEHPSIEMAPFPRLEWDGFDWKGIVQISAWRGFIALQDLCPWITSRERPDGDFRLRVSSPIPDKLEHPSREQVDSFQQFMRNQAALRESVLKAVFAEYFHLKKCYGDFVDDNTMPPITTPNDLLGLIRPGIVHLLANPKDGHTRVGFEFSCKWDDEHGLGVLTHRGAVITVGGADEAFSEYFQELEDR